MVRTRPHHPLFFALFRPIPEKEFVEAYVKAYYLTEPDMERWIREHKVNFYLSLPLINLLRLETYRLKLYIEVYRRV